MCPWNVRFSQELKEPAFAPREAIAGRDARTLAREILGMTPEESSAALEEALDDPEPLVREHAAWALERLRR